VSAASPMSDLSSTLQHNMPGELTPAIELRNVTKRFRTPTGHVYTALRNLSLSHPIDVDGGSSLGILVLIVPL